MKTTTKAKSNKKQKTQKQQEQQELTTAGRVGVRGWSPPNTKGDILDIKTRRMNRKIITHKNTATPTTLSLHFAITAMTILTLLTLLTTLTHADASLGSTFTAKDILLSPGQQEIIEVTFFNTGSTDIDLLIEQTTPIKKTSGISDIKTYIMQTNSSELEIDPALRLISTPATNTPNNNPQTNWIVLGEKGNLYVPAKKVFFLIKVPDKHTYANNKYTLIFRASTQNTDKIKDSTTASIGQLREFPVTVTIQNIIANPQSADQNTNEGPPRDTYTPLTKIIRYITGKTDNLPQPDTNNNYINNNYTQEQEITTIDTAPDTSYPDNIQDTNTTISNTETQEAGTKDQITGLVTENTSPQKTPYNILTIIIIFIGIFALYRIARH